MARRSGGDDDALNAPARLDLFRGALLDRGFDGELQASVERVRAALQTPIALVSLVMKRSQFFRAHSGLPRELEIAQGTDRSVSFCQFVVSGSAPLVVGDVAQNPALPQALLQAYDVRAYAGVPLVVDGEVLGSLCAMDTKVRDFGPEATAQLETIAREVAHRLTTMSRSVDVRKARQLVGGVAFGEIRNLLTSIEANAHATALATTELEGISLLITRANRGIISQEQLHRALSLLADTTAACEDLRGSSDDIEKTSQRLRDTLFGLEATFKTSGDSTVADVVQAAERLAKHHTRLVGEVRWGMVEGGLSLALPLDMASTLVAAALVVVSARMKGQAVGLSGSVRRRGPVAQVELVGPPVATLWTSVAEELRELLPGPVAVEAFDGGLRLMLPLLGVASAA
jgi:GAF domain